MTTLRPAMLYLALLLPLASPAGAAVEVVISLSPSVSYGDPVVLIVEIANPDRSLQRFDIDPVDGLRIEGPYDGGTERSTQIVGRQRVTTFKRIYKYRVTPESGRRGSFTLGPVTVGRRGLPPLESNAVKLGVYRRPELGLRFRAELSNREGVIGEPFTVTYKLSYPQGSAAESPKLPSLPILELADAWVTPVKALPDQKADRVRYGDGALVLQETFVVYDDGSAEPATTFAFEVVPLKPGKITIGSASASAELKTGKTRLVRDFFFGTKSVPETKTFRAETGDVVYTVKPLPLEGRPPGFTGAVGRFTMTVTTEDTEVNAYDPIELKVTVKVDGSVRGDSRKILESLPVPDWGAIAELTRDFDVLSDVHAGEVDGESKVFRQIIRALKPQVNEIPPLPFPYYDPWRKTYAVARSERIPIVVHESKNVGLDETIIRAQSNPAREAAPRPTAIFEQQGVPANFTDLGSTTRFVNARSAVTGMPFLLALALPPLFFALLGMVLRTTQKSPAARARDRAFAKARSALAAAGGDVEAISAAYQDYFRDRFRLPPGEVTPAQLRRELAGKKVTGDLAARASRQLEQLLEGRFGGGAVGSEELAASAEGILRELQRCGARS